jgi:phage portal protein BeeE
MVVSFDPTISKEAFDKFREGMEARHRGIGNAYKTLYLGGGADAKIVGSNFQEIAMAAVQGAGETRIASAAGVPASIVGISEGLAGSALNAGNYTATRRRFADGTLRPLWRAACGALQNLVPPPDGGARLWFDDRDVLFLQEDVKDAADIQSRNALTIESLIRGGFVPDSAVRAVTTGDFTVLEHTGLYSVQLQPPQPDQVVVPDTAV